MSSPTNEAPSPGAEPQTTARVLLIRPAHFGANAETAATNAFQGVAAGSEAEILVRARAEFDGLVAALRAHGVEVVVIEDTQSPVKPDAVFPNNWVSFHPGGRAVLYPLLAPSRRAEVRPELLGPLGYGQVVDLRSADTLEGTGSLVLDRRARVAYACLSPRTTPAGLARFGAALGYEIVAFHAADAEGRAIYHTNVMLSVGTRLALVCLEAIRDADERVHVEQRLRAGGHELVVLTLAQVREFAGNVLELRSGTGAPLFVLSARARAALRPEQRALVERHGTLVSADLTTIETCGGGSARCMLAELF